MKRTSVTIILTVGLAVAAHATSPPPDVENPTTLTAVEALGDAAGTVCNEPAEPSRIAAIAPLDERTYGVSDEPVMVVAVDPSLHASALELEATLIDPLGFASTTWRVALDTPEADDGIVIVELPVWELYRGEPAHMMVRVRAVRDGRTVAVHLTGPMALLPLDGLVEVVAPDTAAPRWPADAAGSPDGIALVETGVAPPPVFATEEEIAP